MEKSILAKEIFKVCHLTGHFTLSSGKTSHEYFDKYHIESRPHLLQAVAEHLAPMIARDAELLAGLEMGGIPVATALSLHTKIPCVFIRKQAKSYGTKRFYEGQEIKNKKLCVIEDVISTGRQVIESIEKLRQEGALVEQVLCIICRGDVGETFKNKNLNLIPLFTKESFK